MASSSSSSRIPFKGDGDACGSRGRSCRVDASAEGTACRDRSVPIPSSPGAVSKVSRLKVDRLKVNRSKMNRSKRRRVEGLRSDVPRGTLFYGNIQPYDSYYYVSSVFMCILRRLAIETALEELRPCDPFFENDPSAEVKVEKDEELEEGRKDERRRYRRSQRLRRERRRCEPVGSLLVAESELPESNYYLMSRTFYINLEMYAGDGNDSDTSKVTLARRRLQEPQDPRRRRRFCNVLES